MNTEDSKITALNVTLKGIKEQSAGFRETSGGAVTDVGADWLSTLYLAAAQEKLTEASGEERWEALRAMVRDCALLRWADHRSGRLQLAREKFEWLKRPEEILPTGDGGIRPETIEKIEAALNLM